MISLVSYIFLLCSFALLHFTRSYSFQSLRPFGLIKRSSGLEANVVNIISKEQFQEIVDSNVGTDKPTVVDFQKSQCKPCIRIAPEFDALAVKYDSQVNFYKVDADTSKEALGLLKQEGVRSVPTFQVYFNGEKVDRVQGAHIDQLETILTGILNSKK